MDVPLITIVIPVYNTSQFLDRCIMSLLNQSYSNIEICLIDDGSTDNSGDICENYCREYKNIKVSHKDNGGVSAARNLGIECATGEWIVFVDSDDYVDREYIYSLFETTQKGCLPFGMTGLTKISKKKESIHKPNKDTEYILSRNACIEMLFNYSTEYWGYVCGKIYNRQILNKHNIKFRENIYFNEDRLFCIEYLSVLDTKAQINVNTRSYYNYIIHENAVTANCVNEKNLTELDAFVIMNNLIRERICSKKLSAIIRCKCLDSMEYLKSQFAITGKLDENTKRRFLDIYDNNISIRDLFPPYYGIYSKRLIKAYFKRP